MESDTRDIPALTGKSYSKRYLAVSEARQLRDADLEGGAVTNMRSDGSVQQWAAVAQLSQQRIPSAAGECFQPHSSNASSPFASRYVS